MIYVAASIFLAISQGKNYQMANIWQLSQL